MLTPKLKLEANKKPWSLHSFPLERTTERIVNYGSSVGIDPMDKRLEGICLESGSNLWQAFSRLDSIAAGEESEG